MNLELLNPEWPAVCLSGIAALTILPPRLRNARAPGGFMRLARGLATVIAFAGAALWLARAGSQNAQALLLLASLAAGVWWVLVRYQGAAVRLSAAGMLMIAGRLLAWFVLLILLARPVWNWPVTEWRKPLLLVILDQSTSMNIADMPALAVSSVPDAQNATLGGGQAGPPATAASLRPRTRKQVVNDAFSALESLIAKLDRYHEVRVRGLEPGAGRDARRPRSTAAVWRIAPNAPLSALAASIRQAARERSAAGEPPLALLLVSDGAENVQDDAAVREAASELARRGVALFAIGAGPRPGDVPTIEPDDLLVPSRIGTRDLLSAEVGALVRGCFGETVGIELFWDREPVASGSFLLASDEQHVARVFEIAPPGPGLHRLTARLSLPASRGGHVFEKHALVEVVRDRLRVLLLEASPRSETAFVSRALLSDPRIDLDRKFLLRRPSPLDTAATLAPETWNTFDVVILGSVPKWRITTRALDALSNALERHGVGLLLNGGPDLFERGAFAATSLSEMSPVSLGAHQTARRPIARADDRPRFIPTDVGLTHAALRQSGDASANRRAWLSLPALGGAATLGAPKPLAQTLARDADGAPLLVVHEFGRGRCAAAAWDATWPWALASDDGAKLHERFWRQLVTWLANRRPQPWVLAEKPDYPLAALVAGRTTVRIRAGVSGLDAHSAAATGPLTSRRDPRTPDATLLLRRPDGETRDVALHWKNNEWTAELTPVTPGSYTLIVRVRGDDDEQWEAAGGFEVIDRDMERTHPTANLELLRAAADVTADNGGEFVRIEDVGPLLARLAEVDRRERIERRVSYDPVDRNRGLWFAALLSALALEWVSRKRGGLV